jgi:hypothetical protein
MEADDTTKSGAMVGETEGSSWHLEVEDDQRKLGCWAKYTAESNC